MKRHCLHRVAQALLASLLGPSPTPGATFTAPGAAPSARFVHLSGTFGWWANSVEICFP
jgi:hypothetical protein